MKKYFKLGNICIILCIIFIISISISTLFISNIDVDLASSNYMKSENLCKSANILGDITNKKSINDGKSTSFASMNKKNNAEIIIDLQVEKSFNTIILKEHGFNVKNFEIYAYVLDNITNEYRYRLIHASDKIEYHRLCSFDNVTARYIKIIIKKSSNIARLKEIEVYNEPVRTVDNFRVCGYYATDWTNIAKDTSLTYNQKVDKINTLIEKYNYKNLTHLFMLCGLGYDELGNVYLYDKNDNQEIHEQALSMVMELIRRQNPNIKISVYFSSSSNNPIINKAMDQNKNNFIQNLISFCNKLGFDGIEIDYEFPQSQYDFKVFDSFLIDLKASMTKYMHNKENSILSCAFGTKDINYSKEAIKSIDIVNCMTYDIFDQDGHHSGFWGGCVQGGLYLESIGFSKEQINIGLPFYGTQTEALMEQYMYCDLNPTNYYENIYTVIDYLGNPTQVYFNSPSMIRDKTSYAILAGYGGVMTWHSTLDLDIKSEFSLWRAINTAVHQYGGVK